MKKNTETILLFLFCAGIIGGLLLPRWMSANLQMDLEILRPEAFGQYTALDKNYKVILEKVFFSRLTLLLVLYFSCYSAAGLWIISGTALSIGLSMGLLAAMLVLQLKYWGIAFWCCALFPQWLFYIWAGKGMTGFMEKRKKRTEFCKFNVTSGFNWKNFAEFLKIFLITIFGIISEAYVNPRILSVFLRFCLNRS